MKFFRDVDNGLKKAAAVEKFAKKFGEFVVTFVIGLLEIAGKAVLGGLGMIVLLCILIAPFALAVKLGQRSEEPLTRTWNVYNGTAQTMENRYFVEISEDDHGSGFERIVHLTQEGKPVYDHRISGHDYNADGVWDAVFICGSGDNDRFGGGCNNVERTANGWKFEPCPADKDRVKPFTESEINFAIGELDEAMKQIHNNEHIQQQWIWDERVKHVVLVFDRKKLAEEVKQ